jgi:hypothetical protein
MPKQIAGHLAQTGSIDITSYDIKQTGVHGTTARLSCQPRSRSANLCLLLDFSSSSSSPIYTSGSSGGSSSQRALQLKKEKEE